MPSIKSAIKQMRVSARKHARNKSVRTEVKTRIAKAEKFIFSGDLEAARPAVAAAVSSLDSAAEKGILHSNNAARRKSRLLKKLNKALALPLENTEPPASE